MSEMVENQSFASAAPSAPAAGESSTPADPFAETQAQWAEPPDEPSQHDAAPGEDGGEDEERGKRPSRSQRLQRKAQLLAAENEQLRRQLGAGARPQWDAAAHMSGAADEQPPREADFGGDQLAFLHAHQAFVMRQAAREALRSPVEREHAQRAALDEAANHRERVVAHYDRVDELKDHVGDFDDAMKVAATINLRDDVAREILGSEKSALIQYHLAKNPDKARELNSLSSRELVRAIGRLEGAVRLPAARRATGATPPVHPLTGATSASFDPFKAEMDEFAAYWNAREAARRRA
jgi:hypothetical protein